MSVIKKLLKSELISPPKFLENSVQYETIMGSMAYGVSGDSSDIDIYGFCIPKKDMIFPHLKGEILGFGRQTKRFEQYQQHGIQANDLLEFCKKYKIPPNITLDDIEKEIQNRERN